MADTSIKSGRFEPKGAVDVIHYLLQKVRGEQVPYYTNVATECDLHSEDETWKKEFVNITDEDEDTLFFFTKSKKKKTEEKSPPIDTTNGGGYGTWMENCIIPMWIINKNNELIGSVQPFDYVKERSPTTTNCERRSCERWVMSEYCLGDIYEESTYVSYQSQFFPWFASLHVLVLGTTLCYTVICIPN